MSLQVWLPLNLDLRNLGLHMNSKITSSNTTLGHSYHIFNGNNSYISLTNLQNFFTGGNKMFSICFWFYHSGDARLGVLFGDYGLDGYDSGFNLEIKTNNKLRFYWKGSIDLETNFTITTQTWYHIAITYDGTIVNLYVNGILNSTYSITLPTMSTLGNWYLGKDGRTGETAFNGKMYDFRIYNHCLSLKEIKEISKGLIFHSKLLSNNYFLMGIFTANMDNLLDMSGFNNSFEAINLLEQRYMNRSKILNYTVYGAYNDSTYPALIGMYMYNNNESYIKIKDLIESNQKLFTISFSIYPDSNQTGCLWNGRSTSGKGVGIFYINNGIRFDDDGSLTLSNRTIPINILTHIVCTYQYGGLKCIYINGVLDKSVSAGAISDKNNQYATIGVSMTADATQSGNAFRGILHDYRIYRTALSAADVSDLYNSCQIIDDKQNNYSYLLVENYQNKFNDTSTYMEENGNLKTTSFSELPFSSFDNEPIIEPDGSVWLHIFHHNNPSENGIFLSDDDFEHMVYRNEHKWFCLSICNYFANKYEFLIKLKLTSESDEEKYRWYQYENPMTAIGQDVTRNDIYVYTKGYNEWSENSAFGGIYHKLISDISYISQVDENNDHSGSIGCISNGQLYKFKSEENQIITTGYMDLYIRIDDYFQIFINLSADPLTAVLNSSIKIGKNYITANEFYEI